MNKKIAILALALCMVAAIAVTGTIAYFTDSDAQTNTFTVGNVDIDLSEPNWEETGKKDAEDAYPGEPLAKDPTVTNIGSNPCFVRIKVTGLDCLAPAGLITLKTDYVEGISAEWVEYEGYYYYYKDGCGVLAAGVKTDALFDQIVIPTDLKNGDAQTRFHVDVYAEAVQAQGAKDPNWAAVQGMTVAEIAAWFATCGM